MLSVTIFINDRPVITRSCLNKSSEYRKRGKQIYHVDDGNVIEHNAEDGCVVLAQKLLALVKEPK